MREVAHRELSLVQAAAIASTLGEPTDWFSQGFERGGFSWGQVAASGGAGLAAAMATLLGGPVALAALGAVGVGIASSFLRSKQATSRPAPWVERLSALTPALERIQGGIEGDPALALRQARGLWVGLLLAAPAPRPPFVVCDDRLYLLDDARPDLGLCAIDDPTQRARIPVEHQAPAALAWQRARVRQYGAITEARPLFNLVIGFDAKARPRVAVGQGGQLPQLAPPNVEWFGRTDGLEWHWWQRKGGGWREVNDDAVRAALSR